MNALIETVELAVGPYGFQQRDYRLPGCEQTLTFEDLLREVGLERSVALEAALADLIKAINDSRDKVERLGWSVAFCSERLVEQEGSDAKNSTMLYDHGFNTVFKWVSYYDIPEAAYFQYNAKTACYGLSVGNLRLEYEELAFAIERENSELEKALVDLQSLVSKRDNSFEQAATLSQKISDARKITLRNL